MTRMRRLAVAQSGAQVRAQKSCSCSVAVSWLFPFGDSERRTSLQHNCAVFFFTRASGMLAIIVVLICSLPAAVSACGFVRLCARVFSRKTPRSLRTPLPHLISPAQTVHQVIAKRAVSYFYQGGYHAGSPRDYASILASQSGALLAGAPYPGARLARSRLVASAAAGFFAHLPLARIGRLLVRMRAQSRRRRIHTLVNFPRPCRRIHPLLWS